MYIDREELLSLYEGLDEFKAPDGPELHVPLEVVIQNIKDMPAIHVPIMHGKWIQMGGRFSRHKTVDRRLCKCSVCENYLSMEGVNAGRGSANYCPNCGAYMSEARDNEID